MNHNNGSHNRVLIELRQGIRRNNINISISNNYNTSPRSQHPQPKHSILSSSYLTPITSVVAVVVAVALSVVKKLSVRPQLRLRMMSAL
jgi:hypothetical protein